MSERPLMLVEILAAEYELQAKMNGWVAPPAEYASANLRKQCDELEQQARKIVPDGATSQESSGSAETSEEKLTPEQQGFVRNETDKLLEGFYRFLHERAKEGVQRTAICFSGGGIRSATFALGLLQGLARRGVPLKQLHYLSTVSGGGYIGSWLSAWIHRQGIDCVQNGLRVPATEPLPSPATAPPCDDEKAAPAATQPASSAAPNHSPRAPEPTTIQHLRRYSNDMSPKLGLLSADTWTLVGIFLRNLTLNWLVLLPLLVAALCAPRLVFAIVCWNKPDEWPRVETTAIILAFLAGIVAVAYQVSNMPSWRGQSRLTESWRTEPTFLKWCWMTLNLSAFLSAFYWAWIHIPSGRETTQFWWGWAKWLNSHLQTPALHTTVSWLAEKWHSWLPFVLFGLLFHVAGYLIARFILIKRRKREGMPDWLDLLVRALTGALGGLCLYAGAMLFSVPPVKVVTTQSPTSGSTIVNQTPTAPTPSPIPTPVSSGVTFNVSSLPAKIEVSVSAEPATAAMQPQPEQRDAQQAGLYTIFGAPIFLLMFLTAATVFVGVASMYTNDADREWMARAGGWVLVSIFGWGALSALAIFAPVGLIWLWREYTVSFSSVSGVSGLLTLIGGFSSKTSSKGNQQGTKNEAGTIGKLFSMSLPLAAAVFAVVILAALSLAASLLIAVVSNWLNWGEALPAFSTKNAAWHLVVLHRSPGLLVFTVTLVVGLVGAAMGVFVNVNKFSLHSAYRDRLIRAYLGASHTSRRPNPFTGFNEQDNLQMHELPIARFSPASFRDDQLTRLAEMLIAEPDKEAKRKASVDDNARKMTCAAALRSRLSSLSPRTLQLLVTWLNKAPQTSTSGAAPKISAEDVKQALSDSFNTLIQGEPLDNEDGFKEIRDIDEEKKHAADDPGRPNIARLIENQPKIPLLPFKRFEKVKVKTVYVEKLLINRLLIERAFPEEILPAPTEPSEPRPLHIINIALNLVGGKELAWQERKAQPFTVSMLHAGSCNLGYRNVKQYAVSRQQNGALSLGTSLAISGAAVSPNMGYNSSPPVTFLLSLFNVRLGWWLGNPGNAGRNTYTKHSPFFAPRALIDETLGLTDSLHPYVYLSDGAHFENLAFYEMVRRRCHLIIVSDAGADGDFNFDDLGNALRKIRIDLGVPVEFLWDMPIQPRVKNDALFAEKSRDEDRRRYCALANIKYSEADGEGAKDGILIYIKPTVYGIEPPDVQNYAKANLTFPHETTGDQMYSESQFESYRALGEYVVAQMTGGKNVLNIKSLLREVRQYLGQNAPDELAKPSDAECKFGPQWRI